MSNSSFKVNSRTAKQGQVNVSGRGVDPQSVSVEFQSLETIVVSSKNPSNGEANVGETIEYTITGTTNPVVATVDPNDGSFSVTPDTHNPYKFLITASHDGLGELVVTGDTVEDLREAFMFSPADNLSLSITPSNEVTRDKEIEITVSGTTKNITASASDSKIVLTPAQAGDPTNKSWTVTATDAIEGTVVFSGVGVNSATARLNFRAGDVINLSLQNEAVRVGTENIINVTGADSTRTLLADSDNPNITPTVDDYQTIRLSATQQGTATIRVHGDYIQEKSIEVKFLPEKDDIVVTLDPASGIAKVGQIMTATVSSTISTSITATSDNGDISVSPSGKDRVWNIVARQPGRAQIEFSAPDILTESVNVEFEEAVNTGPQFIVSKTYYTGSQEDYPMSFTVDNLVGKLSARSSNAIVFPATVKDNVVTVKLNNQLKKTTSFSVTLHVDGQQDVVVMFNVEVPEELPDLPINGKVITGEKGKEIYFNLPPLDSDDVIDATCSDIDLDIEIRDINRVYINSNVAKTYLINVSHTEYKPGVVTYVCTEPYVEPVKPAPAPEEYYDLGPAPEVQINAPEGEFVSKTFEEPTITTDEEKISYILANAPFDFKAIGHFLCTYAKKMDPNGVILSAEEGSRLNRSLYQRIMYILTIPDYYEFRERFRLLIKIFKIYKDNSFSLMNALRYDNNWIEGPEALEQYKLFIAFVEKYIKANGQGVKVGNLPFKDSIVDKIVQYCSENIQP